nr:hypothetical protein CFP56_08002 [Quercus suber]
MAHYEMVRLVSELAMPAIHIPFNHEQRAHCIESISQELYSFDDAAFGENDDYRQLCFKSIRGPLACATEYLKLRSLNAQGLPQIGLLPNFAGACHASRSTKLPEAEGVPATLAPRSEVVIAGKPVDAENLPRTLRGNTRGTRRCSITALDPPRNRSRSLLQSQGAHLDLRGRCSCASRSPGPLWAYEHVPAETNWLLSDSSCISRSRGMLADLGGPALGLTL